VKGWPTRDASLQPATVKGTSASCTRASLRGAPHGSEPRPVSTLAAQTICDSGMDAGDTGTEEAAKERSDQSPPCGDSPHHFASRGERRKERLARSPRLSFVGRSARDPRAQARGRATRKLTPRRGARRARSVVRKRHVRLEPEADCGPPRSECARPRGSARTSRLIAEVGGRCLAPNKFSARAAKTAVRRE